MNDITHPLGSKSPSMGKSLVTVAQKSETRTYQSVTSKLNQGTRLTCNKEKTINRHVCLEVIKYLSEHLSDAILVIQDVNVFS